MLHLDQVDDLDGLGRMHGRVGATLAEFQPQKDDFRVT